MDRKFRWGIMGPGNIAHKFAQGLSVLPDAELYAVGSRTALRADEFGERYGVPKRYGSYEELVNDPEIDAIYVATPHPFHKECTVMSLRAGKPVLCEKPFTVNAEEACEVIEVARKNKVFLMEAMWTRFLPAMVKVRQWLEEGTIGEIRMLTADFGFRGGNNPKSRLMNPALAGGSLLDVGVYTLSLASMVFGAKPAKIAGLADMGETGVDEQSAFILGYDKGRLAVLSTAIRTRTPQGAVIMGTDGYIQIPDFWHATSVILNISGKEPEHFEIPFEGTGYNYEAQKVMECLKAGDMESKIMTLDETYEIMKTMDSIRRQWGLKYPME